MPAVTSRRPQRQAATNHHRGARRDAISKTREVTMRDIKDTTQRSVSGPTASSIQLHVTGWRASSKLAGNDQGTSALVSFLERRANISNRKHKNTKGVAKTHNIRIRKSSVDGDILVITISSDDARSFLSVNGYEWGGVNIKITLADGSGGGVASSFSFNGNNSNGIDVSNADEVRKVFRSILADRYYGSEKLLDLSSLEQEPQFHKIGVYELRDKIFQALMKICDTVFPTAERKEEAVQSIRLAHNKLKDLTIVTTMAQTFPALKNLDLSNNNFVTMRDLSRWRHKFRHLEHIILSNNPIETEVADFKTQLIRWYPKLHSIDLVRIPEAELAAIRDRKGPPKTQPGCFEDVNGIAETFLRNFFPGYDTDRSALAQYYYDDQSTFQINLSTRALREASQPRPQSNEWADYIRHSRNLLKINHPSARARRSYRGTEQVTQIFSELPASRHPDFATSPEKWMIECHPLPGLPDPTGSVVGGVNGLIVTVHGEFEEPKTGKLRSFDRTFVLGPGGPDRIRVVSDMVTIRAYGGHEAYAPDVQETAPFNEAQERELMAVEVAKLTGMNMEYSVMCLEQSGWSLQDALAAYEKVKATIPAQAYAQ